MKKAAKSILLITVFLSEIMTAAAQSKREKVPSQEFENIMRALSDEQIVDVRTPEEFSKGYIEGAFNIDINGPEFKKQMSALDKSKPVLIYCLSGGRSEKAAGIMRKQGFARVVELDGGLLKWNAAKKPLERKKAASNGITPAVFQRQLEGKLVLVDFYAPWCAPCKKMAPELQSLQEEYSDKLSLLKINADDNRQLMDSLKIEAIPALLIFNDGKLKWSHSGLAEKDTVRSAIQENL